MRQSVAAILIAGAAAQVMGNTMVQQQQQAAPQPQPFQGQGFQGPFPGQAPQQMQGVPQMQQMQGVPQLGGQLPQGMQLPQQVQLPQQAMQLPQQGMQLPQQAAQAGQTNANLNPQVKGIPIGTAQGVTDSDRACKAGVVSACGMPNIPNLWNEDPNMRYQTQQSDQLLWQLYETGNYAANGQRVVNQNPVGIDIPYYQTGNMAGGNFGAVYTVNPNDPFRRPVNSLVNYVTNDNRAPEGFRPSASNAVLSSSSAYLWANANPQATTPVNTVTGAGFGYSDKVNAPGTSPVFTGGNWNQGLGNFGQNWNLGGQGFLGNVGQNWNMGGQSFLGNVGQNLGYFGNQGFVGGVPTVGQNWNLGGQGFMAPRSSNLGFNLNFPTTGNFNTGLRPGGAFGNYMPNSAPPTQNWLPTLPNGMTTAPAWTPTTGTGYNGPNVAPQQGQQPRWP